MRNALILLAIASAAACAPNVGEAFLQSKAAGDRALSAGRYEEAAHAYQEAADAARRPRDRDEALFLEANVYRRARDWEKAKAAYRALLAESPEGDRAARATYELAWIEIETGNRDEGFAMLEGALFAHPDAGPARRALKRFLAHLEEREDTRAAIAWIDRSLDSFRGSALEENLRYERAKLLESLGELAAARDAYVDCARRHPYPFGSLFDDALWNASMLDEALGRYELAIQDLEELLRHREASTLTGSYERPRYADAQMRIAELYRDRIGDLQAARRAFHTLYAAHQTSRLRDDALWEEAKIARQLGDLEAACSLTSRLRREFPESRYAGCAKLLCESAPVDPQNECRPYITKTYGRAEGE